MKKRKNCLWIGLPAYNEEKAVKKVLLSIHSLKRKLNNISNLKVIIFNDGSTDNTEKETLEFKKKLNIKIINNTKNQGLGIGIFSILRFFVNNALNNDKLVLMDCDNTHNPNQIIKMLEKAKGRESFIVIASRFIKNSNVNNIPTLRNILTITAYSTLNILFKTKGIKDFTSGYRMYDKIAVKKFFKIIGNNYKPLSSFAMQLEILLQVRKTKITFLEIPIILDYDKKPTKSKMNVIKTILSYLKLITLRLIN